ncbi:MAG: helix-turn-helix domain-containing protein [Veillonellales bacterium]
MDQFIKKITCINCGLDNKWQILNDSGNIVAWCSCGAKMSIGFYHKGENFVLPDTMAKVLNERELGQWLNISSWTVRSWRLKGGLPFIKVGHRIFYNTLHIEAWLNNCKTNQIEEENWEIINGRPKGYGTIRPIK